MSDIMNFMRESLNNIQKMASDDSLQNISQAWINQTGPHRYVYNWRWMGLPIIQLPADIAATQEIIWEVKPTVIIETGIARGGSLVFNASQLALLDLCSNGSVSVTQSKRRCIGIDIDIRSHNRSEIESHALAPMITLVKGSSVDGDVVRHVATMIKPEDRVLVILDSNHTCQHVKQELNYYSKLVSSGSYLIVHDTGIEFAPEEFFENRDWGKGNNPLTAVKEFLNENETFKIDRHITDKLLITSSPEGYLKKIRI